MSSGLSSRGGSGKCYPFWVDFLTCMYSCDTADERFYTCPGYRDDYLACVTGIPNYIRNREIYRVQKAKKDGSWDPAHYVNRVETGYGVPAMEQRYYEEITKGKQEHQQAAEE